MNGREATVSRQERLLSIDINEGDPFEDVELSVVVDGTLLGVGTVSAEPGKYVLVRKEHEGDGQERILR